MTHSRAMEEIPLGIDDGDWIETFDPATVTAIDGGTESIVIATDDRAYTTVESAMIEIDPGEQINEYTGVAAADTVAVVADETVYRITGGLASHQRRVPGALDVFIGPNDDCLTVLCADGSLIWLDPAAKLREVGTKRTEIDPAETVAAAAAGWTALSDGKSVYCYREPVEGSVAIAEIGPKLLDGTVRDLSFVDGYLVIATSARIVSFDPAADFKRQWTLELTVTGLSNPASNHVYGWNDEVVRISSEGRVTTVAETSHEIATTVDHSKWYAVQGDEAAVRERNKTVSVELSIDSVAYRDREPVFVEVTNPTTDRIDYELTVSATGLELRSEEISRISVSPLCRTSIQLATVSPRDRVQSGSVTVTRASNGGKIAERSVTVTYGEPDVRATAELSEISPDGREYAVTACNDGSGVAFLDTADPPTPDTWNRITPGETVELFDTADEGLYVIGADPNASSESVNVETATTLPEPVYSVSCSLGPRADLLRIIVENHTTATIRDAMAVNIENGPGLTGPITVEPDGRSEIWVDTPEKLPPILRLTINGSLIEETTVQVSDHQFLGLERRFFDTDGSSVELSRVPQGDRFEERLTIRNDTDETLLGATVGHGDEYTLPDLSPGAATTVSRQVALPTRESSVPSVTIGDADEQIELPERVSRPRLRLLRLLAAVRPTDTGFTLLVEVECDDRDQFSAYILESLRLDGEPLLDSLDVDREFPVGETHQRQLSLTVDSADRLRQLRSQPPQPVTAEFSKPDSKVRYERSTLAPITDSAFAPSVKPRMEVIQDKLISSDKHRLVLELSNVSAHSIIITIRGEDGGSIESYRCRNPPNRITKQFQTNEKFIRVSVNGTGGSSLDNGYIFHRSSTQWRLKDRSEQTPLPTEPIVTPWEEL